MQDEKLLYLIRNMRSVRLTNCGLAMLNPGWTHMRRRLDTESVLVIGRRNTTLIDDEGDVVEIKPGRAVLLGAKRLHRGIKPIEKAVSYYWIHFTNAEYFEGEDRYFFPVPMAEQDRLSYRNDPMLFMREKENCLVLPREIDLQNPDAECNLCSDILHEYAKPTFSRLLADSMLLQLLIHISREYAASCASTVSESEQGLVTQLKVMVEEELSNPNASVKYFAAKLGVNCDYLGHAFKKAMDTSVGKYIAGRRVDVACCRLRESNDSIEQIAAWCGFGSRRQFYDTFRQFTGTTPAVYRSESAYIGMNAL